jgi:hypothetical protein
VCIRVKDFNLYEPSSMMSPWTCQSQISLLGDQMTLARYEQQDHDEQILDPKDTAFRQHSLQQAMLVIGHQDWSHGYKSVSFRALQEMQGRYGEEKDTQT